MPNRRIGGYFPVKIMALLGWLMLLAACLPSPVRAAKWAEIPRELLLLQSNPYDPGAGALIVFNNGGLQLFYKNNIWWELKVYRRMKIFNDSGKRYATVTLSYGEGESIADIEARTILPNGTIVQLDKMQIFDTPRISGLGRYAALAYGKAKRFTIPGVENGAIIEYRYTKTSEDIFFLDPWFFQSEDHTLRSTFMATVPREFQYVGGFVNMRVEPQSSLERWVDGRGNTYTWTVENLPGIKTEPFMPSPEHLRGGMHFVMTYYQDSDSRFPILDDWNRVAEGYGDAYRSRMGRRGRIPGVVQELTAGASTPAEKIARIFDYVQRQIQYVPLEGVGTTGNYAGSILDGKQAENVDMNVLLMAMLDEAGITAYPAMLAPRDGLPLNQGIPSPVQFKRLITCVPLSDGQVVWLDPVIRGTPYGILPWQDQGVAAFVVRGPGSWITTPETTHLNRETRTLKVFLIATGQVTCSGSIAATGQNAIEYRRRYAYVNDEEQRKTFLTHIQKQVTGIELERFAFVDQLNGADPVNLSFSFRGTDYATVAGKRLLVNPALMERLDRDLLPAGQRVNSIQLGPVQETMDQVTLVVPEGYTVEQLPAPVTVQSPFGRFLAAYRETSEGIVYTRRFSMTQPNLSAQYYNELRAFFDQISLADQQQIVLRAIEK